MVGVGGTGVDVGSGVRVEVGGGSVGGGSVGGTGVKVGEVCVVAQAVMSNSATSRKTMFFIVLPSVKKKVQPRLMSGNDASETNPRYYAGL